MVSYEASLGNICLRQLSTWLGEFHFLKIVIENVVIYLQQVRGVQLRSEVYQVSPYLVTKVSEPHPKLCKPSTDSIIFCL